MYLLRKIILFILLHISFVSHAQECNSELIDWSNYDKTLNMLRMSYHNDDFYSVEKALICLLKSDITFISGKTGAIAAYWFFRNEMPAPGADKQDKLRIMNWKKAINDSVYADFAKLRLMYSEAWNARGTKYANETKEDQFKRFKEKLLDTESLILSKDNKLKETPISYNLLMAVALDTNATKSSAMNIFNDGVKNWPNYYDFYEVVLSRLVPKWGGSWEQVDQFINYWAMNLKTTEADSIYARLYYNVHSHNKIDPRKTLVKWPKLKTSLKSLYTKYPAKEHFDIAASYACIYGDQKFYSNLVLKNKVITSKYWIIGTSKESCDSYFKALPNNAFTINKNKQINIDTHSLKSLNSDSLAILKL